MLYSNTIYQSSKVKDLKFICPVKEISNPIYNFKLDSIVSDVGSINGTVSSIYLEYETYSKNDLVDTSSFIITKEDANKLLKRLTNTIEELDKKEEAIKNLKNKISDINVHGEDSDYSILFEVLSKVNDDTDNTSMIYKITLCGLGGLELYSILMPLYLVGKYESDKNIIQSIFKFPSDRIKYGPKLNELGKKNIEKSKKDALSALDKRISLLKNKK